MRIAFISLEYPPDTAFGGIATYVYQISTALAKHKIDVEVFTATPMSNNKITTSIIDGVVVHRIPYKKKKDFRENVVTHFASIHLQKPFDLIESPEFGADGLYIKKRFPQLPLVVKLHMPWYFIKSINKAHKQNSLKEKFKRTFGIKQYKKENDKEYQLTKLADAITTPSISLGEIVSKDWSINPDFISHLPNPYFPNKELLHIPIPTNNNRVTYTGRLEIRKGIINLASAIKIVIDKRPQTKFRLVGKSEVHTSGKPMIDFLRNELKNYWQNIEWINNVPVTEIPKLLSETDVCVYPSIWENFPNTCLEAMAAGRGIVASKEGGMNDMLQDVEGGILINPNNCEEIAHSIIKLLDDIELRKKMGEISRKKIIEYYSSKLIFDTIKYYEQVIENANAN